MKIKIISFILILCIIFSISASCSFSGENNGEYTLAYAKNTYSTGSEAEDEMMLKKVKQEIKRQQKYFFTSVEVPNKPFVKNEMAEICFDITATYKKQECFSPFIVEINAYITTPLGEMKKVPAFYKQEEGLKWAFRYNPSEIGEYTFYLKDEKSGEKTNPQTFTVIDGENRGKLKVKDDFFVDANDNIVLLNGFNMTSGYTVEDYQNASKVFGENGVNLIRFWVWDWHTNYQLEGGKRSSRKAGDVKMTSAKNIDSVLESMQENEVYTLFCLYTIWEFLDVHWAENQFNVENGGTVEWKMNKTDWWRDSLAVKYHAQLIRYVASRYSAYSSFGIMEYFNECEAGTWPVKSVKLGMPEVAKWHQIMSAEFDRNNPYNTPDTTSFAYIDDFNYKYGEKDGNVWNRFTFAETTVPHCYHFEDNFIEKWIGVINATKNSTENIRPSFFGEFGWHDREESLQDNYYFVTENVWASLFMCDSASTGLYWFNGYKMYEDQTFMNIFKVRNDFLKEYDIGDFNQQYLGVKSGFHVGSLKNQTTTLLYLTDGSFSKSKINYVNEVITLEGYEGEYSLSFVNVETGETIAESTTSSEQSTLNITLPNFDRYLAIKITKK